MPCDYLRLSHAGIQSLSPYIPGKSSAQVAKEFGVTDIIKLASNENPYGCSSRVREALANLTGLDIATYPIASLHPLREKIAARLGINANQVTLGNGSDPLFSLTMTCFALHTHKHVMTHQYAFIAYGIQAKTLGIPVVTIPLKSDWQVDIEAMIDACDEHTAIIFLASPNNPTGIRVPETDIKKLLTHLPPTTLLVLDEAYYDFIPDAEKPNTLSLLTEHPNLIITRTFSKAYGLAGLRLGYAIASPEITSVLCRVLPPFDVNTVALTAASAALDDEAFVRMSVEKNTDEKYRVEKGLKTMGFECLPSATNFITFDYRQDTIPLFQRLQQDGIIVRPLHPYGLINYMRVTIGTEQQNTRFLDTLEELLNEK